MSMLDLRRMMLLRDLADLGTVTAVAERRSITNSAVSQQLRVLEVETGSILFRRDGRTLGLTRSGRILVDHVRVVLGAVDDAMSALAATRDQVSGQIAMVSYNLGIPVLAAPLIHLLSAEEPHVQIHLQQAEADDALRLLRQGEVDVAVTYRCDFEAQDLLNGLSREVLLVEPFVLLAPTGLHARVRGLGLAALAEQVWVTGLANSTLDTALLRAAERAGFTPRITHRLVTAQIVCDLAATEVVSAIVPRLSVPAHLEHLIVEGVPIGYRTVSSVARTTRRNDPNIALVLRTLRLIGEQALHRPVLRVAS
ncbi:LysR family transcriptional regulator [Streptomyces sp. CBMA29]|uniref:LysR family transcriptional regulator n=1 Tax=Streptomyces sp. CBMA29 TaxID=1896314 RepID=UPI001CB6E519|nr:LysR family transcriptional regulator [Streptomyces sp. CBMA29]